MKKIVLILAMSLAIVSCKNEKEIKEDNVQEGKEEIAYASFGLEINDADALSSTLRASQPY